MVLKVILSNAKVTLDFQGFHHFTRVIKVTPFTMKVSKDIQEVNLL
jgi:hypothetical protein